MEDFDRKSHWEGVWGRRSPLEVSWYQQEPTLSLELIKSSGVAPEAPLIDVGGGASSLVDTLIAAGYADLSVLDLSRNALRHAEQRLGPRASRVEWIEADVTGFRPARRYALWHDRAVFHFLTDPKDRAAYRRVLEQALAPGGTLLLAAFAIGGPRKCSGLDIVQYDAPKLLAELGPGYRLIEQREEGHQTPGGAVQAFGWYRLVREA